MASSHMLPNHFAVRPATHGDNKDCSCMYQAFDRWPKLSVIVIVLVCWQGREGCRPAGRPCQCYPRLDRATHRHRSRDRIKNPL